jgi:hypothetical protein
MGPIFIPTSFFDQVSDVLYKQVIDTESYNPNSMTLFPYDPSDNHENSINGVSANLTLCPKMIIRVQFAQ